MWTVINITSMFKTINLYILMKCISSHKKYTYIRSFFAYECNFCKTRDLDRGYGSYTFYNNNIPSILK